MAARSIVGTDRLETGEIVCAATTRGTQSLWRGDGRGWTLQAEWRGKEVTACCAVGGAVVCPALDGALYVVRGEAVEKLALPEPGAWIYDAVALEDGRALLGGSHGLVFHDPASGSVTGRRLREYPIEKPGRTIHAITRAGGRVLLAGARNLVLEYRDETLVERANRATFGGREILFGAVAAEGERLWLGGPGLLAAVEGGAATVWDDPLGEGMRGAGVRLHGDRLLVFQESVVVGRPGAWEPLVPGFRAPDLLAVVDSPVEGELVALCCSGAAFALAGGEARPVPLFGAA